MVTISVVFATPGLAIQFAEENADGAHYKWDAENRLVSYDDITGIYPGSTNKVILFDYDYLDRLVKKTVYTDFEILGGGSEVVAHSITIESYVYDGWNRVQTLSVDETAGTFTIYESLAWGLDLSGTLQGAGGVGGLLNVIDSPAKTGNSTNVYYYAYDANGNVSEVLKANPMPADALDQLGDADSDGQENLLEYAFGTDPLSGLASATFSCDCPSYEEWAQIAIADRWQSATIAAHYEYSPFGETTYQSGTYADENPYRFSTKHLDTETELYYYGYRYYDPETGRWLSRDPIEEQGGLNLYAFVGNDGVNAVDALGLLSQSQISDLLVQLEEVSNYLEKNLYNSKRKYRLKGQNAAELLFGTALVESDLKYRRQIGGGPALGLYQMEPATHDDIWRNFLEYRKGLKCAIELMFTPAGLVLDSNRLVADDDYATAMARVHYYRAPSSLPSAGALRQQASYWKTYYNTNKGKGTVNDYIEKWNKYHGITP